MKATGIIRRVDDLGRFVIPKEIRRTMRIKEGDPLEIFIDSKGEIILKKYSPISELKDHADLYAQAIAEALNCGCIITDTDNVISVSNIKNKEIEEEKVSSELTKIVNENKMYGTFLGDKIIPITNDAREESKDYNSQIILPVSVFGDTIGSVVLISLDKSLGEKEMLTARTASLYLSKQMGNV